MEWRVSNQSAYIAAKRLGLVEEIVEFFGWEWNIHKVTPYSYWTIERCKEEALKYNSRSEWQRKSSSSYHVARENKWLDECTIHMVPRYLSREYWTLEKCKEEALKYNSRAEWNAKSSISYLNAKNYCWLNECCGHMGFKATLDWSMRVDELTKTNCSK